MFRTKQCMAFTSHLHLVYSTSCNSFSNKDKEYQRFLSKGDIFFLYFNKAKTRILHMLKYTKFKTSSSKYITDLHTENSDQPINILSRIIYIIDINAYRDMHTSYSYKAIKFKLLLLNYITYLLSYFLSSLFIIAIPFGKIDSKKDIVTNIAGRTGFVRI